MKSRLIVCMVLLAVTACQPCAPKNNAATLEPYALNYAQLDRHAFLKGKIAVGEVEVDPAQHLPFTAQDVKTAMAAALKRAGFAAHTAKAAPYLLTAHVITVDTIPVCSLSTCTSKAEIEYRLTDRKHHVVYTDVITSPHHYPGVLVSADCLSKHGAIRNNFFELFLDLGRITKADLKPHRS